MTSINAVTFEGGMVDSDVVRLIALRTQKTVYIARMDECLFLHQCIEPCLPVLKSCLSMRDMFAGVKEMN
ncbi:MAG: hypothetical protein ACK5UY_04595 [Holosporales bacterium]